MSGFAKESDLCAAFIAALPKGWTAYAETGGFDILLACDADGFQIGVEAKLRLNAKVICQAAEGMSTWHVAGPQPDCRAVLVPAGCGMDLVGVCTLLGITVIRVVEPGGKDPKRRFSSDPFYPRLPGSNSECREQWFERAPAKRVKLPDYVPDTISGDSAPLKLTEWKIKAIKIVVLLARRGAVHRADFKAIGIDMSRWINPHARWLVKAPEGGWVAGPYLPDFRAQHPVNFAQIEDTFEKWAHPPVAVQAVML